MITSTIHCNIAREDRDNDRRCITSLYAVPKGTRVVIYVGHRDFATPDTARFFAEYALDLHLEVTGDPLAVERWTTALREYA